MKKSLKIGLCLLALITITFLAFSPVLHSGFIQWDDNFHLTNNESILGLDGWHLKKMFTETVNHIYIPLTTFSYAIEYHFFGLNPLAYHLTNLILHLGIVCLVFLFTLQLRFNYKVAFTAALLFAIHPMHVESVAWITERKDVLYVFFYLLSVYSYVHFLLHDKKTSYGISLFWGFLSILAKPMALSLPLILFVCDWWHREQSKNKGWKQFILNKIPFFLYIIPITWMTYRLHSRIPGEGVVKSALTWIWTFTFYLIKFFHPIKLTPFYSLPEPIALTNPTYLFSFCLFVIIITSIYYFRKNQLYLLAWLFYFLSIFFLLRFDTKVDLGIVTDRFMYLPSLGFCILIANLFFNKKYHSLPLVWIRNTILITLIGTLGWKAYQQNTIWINDRAFWDYVIELDPTIPIAYNNRGSLHDRMGEYGLAINDFDQALKLNPNYIECLCNRGTLTYFYLKSYEESLKYYQRAIQLNPEFAQVYLLLASIHIHQKKYELAEDAFLQAFKYNPQDSSPLRQLSKIYILIGKDTDAIKILNQLTQLDISQEEKNTYLSQLAAIYYRNAQFEESFKVVEKIFRFNHPQNFIQVANTFSDMHLFGPALELLNTALSLYPRHPELYVLYGDLLMKENKKQAALNTWEKGREIAPQCPELIDRIKALKGRMQN